MGEERDATGISSGLCRQSQHPRPRGQVGDLAVAVSRIRRIYWRRMRDQAVGSSVSIVAEEVAISVCLTVRGADVLEDVNGKQRRQSDAAAPRYTSTVSRRAARCSILHRQ